MPRPDAPQRHHDMRSAIGWTYNLLTSFQRQLLRRLSVAGGTFGIDDAVALSDGELSEVLDALSALVDFHLVLPASSDGAARLELAPSIRAFMAEHLAASGEGADVEARWIGWLAAQARNAARGISAEEPDSWWVWLDGAHDCLRNALQKCLEYRRAEPALDIAAALAPYWDAGLATPRTAGFWTRRSSSPRSREFSPPHLPRCSCGQVSWAHACSSPRRQTGTRACS